MNATGIKVWIILQGATEVLLISHMTSIHHFDEIMTLAGQWYEIPILDFQKHSSMLDTYMSPEFIQSMWYLIKCIYTYENSLRLHIPFKR